MTKIKTIGLKKYNQDLNHITCESLQESLVYLMNKKEFSAISITELCHKAGVSRMAFYNNYKSKEDVLKSIVIKHNEELINEIGSPFRQHTNLNWYIKMFESVKNISYFLKTIFNAGFKYDYLSIINNLVTHDKSISSTKKYMRIIWSGGIVNAIIHWLDNDMQESIDEIAKFCFDNLSVWTN